MGFVDGNHTGRVPLTTLPECEHLGSPRPSVPQHHAGTGAGDRAGAGLAVRRLLAAHRAERQMSCQHLAYG